MWANKYDIKEIFIGKGDYNADLLESLNDFCRQNNIETGIINAIGAVKNIKIGYYRQDVKEYVTNVDLSDKAPFEIVNCTGNVSLKDGKPFCHLHIVISDSEGNCYGGHLLNGVKIYALEFTIFSLNGEKLNRGIDETTLLPLWIKALPN